VVGVHGVTEADNGCGPIRTEGFPHLAALLGRANYLGDSATGVPVN
jgi:hypothetical protein